MARRAEESVRRRNAANEKARADARAGKEARDRLLREQEESWRHQKVRRAAIEAREKREQRRVGTPGGGTSAHYPSAWLPAYMRPNTASVDSLPGLALPFQRSSSTLSLGGSASTLSLGGVSEATTRRKPRRNLGPRTLPALPQNNLKGFDIPTYMSQPMFGSDKRCVPYW